MNEVLQSIKSLMPIVAIIIYVIIAIAKYPSAMTMPTKKMILSKLKLDIVMIAIYIFLYETVDIWIALTK